MTRMFWDELTVWLHAMFKGKALISIYCKRRCDNKSPISWHDKIKSIICISEQRLMDVRDTERVAIATHSIAGSNRKGIKLRFENHSVAC